VASYAPLSVRIVERAVLSGWSGGFADALRLLPGAAEELSQDTGSAKSGDASTRIRKTVVVFFIGGVTYLEVAALRHLSEKCASRRDGCPRCTGGWPLCVLSPTQLTDGLCCVVPGWVVLGAPQCLLISSSPQPR